MSSTRDRLGRGRRWATLVAIPCVLILLALGSWQVSRLIWKTELNEFRLERANAEAVALPASIEQLEPFLYRPVWLEGRFLHASEMYLGARSHRSNSGFHVITPFERSDGSHVLINRGWIPLDRKDSATRAEAQFEGTVRLEGLVVGGDRPGWFTPDNRPDENFWFWVDVESLYAKAGLAPLPFLIDAGAAPNPGGYPVGGQTRLELRNEHLQYAIIWYALAVALAVIFVLFMRGKPRAKPNPERG